MMAIGMVRPTPVGRASTSVLFRDQRVRRSIACPQARHRRPSRRSVDAPECFDRGRSQKSLEDDAVAVGPLLQLVEALGGHIAR